MADTNQCDGCSSGMSLHEGKHYDRHGFAIMSCQAHKYAATTPADAALDNVHSCSYFCLLQPCINRQRDELREKYFTALDDLEYHKAAADANAQLNAMRRSIENGTEQ